MEYDTGRVHDPAARWGFYGVRNRGELLARFETPEEAVALVLADLPEGIGSAH
ncbi:hypothetical protein GCM10025734_80410 [Kitasatospora paranensis]|uniref:DUF6193 family natural product biosynthesis protein n=1 Tax=Kitasatospora paranensis TaxID=258053 RepID=UPI0031EFE7E3